MATLWDEGLKRILAESPQDFITWLVRDAVYLNQVSSELYLELERHRKVVADAVCTCTLYGQPIAVHVEFQSESDRDMALRLLEYNVVVERKHHCPVISCVIYLRKDHPIVESPLIKMLEDGQPIYQFHFLVIKLWELSADDLVRAHLPGILALLPLTKNGRDREVIEEMITQLQVQKKEEVLSLGYLLASLTWKEDEEQRWLKRRFNMLYEALRESWAFKEIWDEGQEVGLEKGRQEGRQEGFEKGRQEGLAMLRKAVLAQIEKRFPRLLRMAQGMVTITSEPAALGQMLLGITLAQTVEEAQAALLEENEDGQH
ncbi:MAG: Rpn family recombination-promoting nuclease/putative transposase [Chloroflexota bacterium]|nr:Rpn family recombination-promoting nuclease/putative transposase [Chloroflexota bacterium]